MRPGVWRAPGRVNLVGEHTDHQQGLVLPFAIDRGVTVTASLRDDDVVACRSIGFGPAPDVRIRDLRPASDRGWWSYAHGVLWALRATRGMELAYDSDLPAGAGLASSAALTCATALAVAELQQLDAGRHGLAAAARRA